MTIRFVTPEHQLRKTVEQHIRQVYKTTYNATLRSFPYLIAADVDDEETIGCAVGLRMTTDGFFSECYVDRPLDEIVSEIALETIARDRIVEITNLASNSSCSLARMVPSIVEFTHQNGMEWAVFTITPRLKKRFCRMKFPIREICAAERSRVANPEDWGSYYETLPMVAVLKIPRPESIDAAVERPALPVSKAPAIRSIRSLQSAYALQ